MPRAKRIVVRDDPIVPAGNWLTRGFHALLIQGRLPYQVAHARDRLLCRMGLAHTTIATHGLQLTVRRLTTDWNFVQQTIESRAYTPAGYQIGPGDTVIDVGANIGAFTCWAGRQATRGRVYGFEPVPANFELLARNVARNELSNVELRPWAVTDRSGVVSLQLDARPLETGTHTIFDHPRARGHSIEVPCVTLAEIFDQFGIERCQLLKLDCEGAEYPILRSLPDEYWQRIDRVAMEYHEGYMPRRQAETDELVERIEAAGLEVDTYDYYDGKGCGMIRARRTS